MIEVGKDNFDAEVLKSDKPVLVDFWAAWCGPCQSLSPVVEKLAGDFSGKAKMVKCNVDDHPEVASQFGIMGIPTLILFAGGEEKERLVGVQNEDKLRRVLGKYIQV